MPIVNINGFGGSSSAPSLDPFEGMTINRLLDTESIAATQNPTGKGIAFAKQIEFGDAVSNEYFTLDILGTLTILKTGLYLPKVSYQVGRTGSNNESHIYVYVEVNGAPRGRSVFDKIANADDVRSFSDLSPLYLAAGTVIKYMVVRDEAGDDSGGLIKSTPTDPSLRPAPTASLRLEIFDTITTPTEFTPKQAIKEVTSPYILSNTDSGYLLIFNESTDAVLDIPDGLDKGVSILLSNIGTGGFSSTLGTETVRGNVVLSSVDGFMSMTKITNNIWQSSEVQ